MRTLLFIWIFVLCFMLWDINSARAEVELSDKQIETCKVLTDKVGDIQQWRRDNPQGTEKDYKALIDVKDPDVLLWYTLTEKVFLTPIAVPPVAIQIDFNSHCVATMKEINALKLET